MEIAKLIQSIFIQADIEMYYPRLDKSAIVRSSGLNEELGQVEWIFSDKTGTLTRNMMEFMKFSCSGISYGTGITEIAKAAAKRKGIILQDER
jgi:P-type E1-E2 ATPase